MDDFTSKYKGEQVDIELFGGEVQDGTLTAYCGVEGVPHIELNGHILIPLQNVASLHCSSRCDAPEPDWPPRASPRATACSPPCGEPSSQSATSPRRGCSLGGLAGGLFALGWWLGGLARQRLRGRRAAHGRHRPLVRASGRPRLAEGAGAASRRGACASLHGRKLGVQSRRRAARLFLLADGHPRAFVVGRGVSLSGIAVSEGLLGLLSPAELEGALAHLLGRVRHRDVVVETAAVVVAGWLVEASRIGGWLERALLFVLGPVAASIAQHPPLPRRVLAADAFAARICESPHPLADALVRIEQAQELISFRASPTTEPVYVVNPSSRSASRRYSRPSRRWASGQRLRDLDPDWRERLRAA